MSKRIRYFLGHLLVSFILAVLTTLLVTKIWYPSPLFEAAGLAKIFFMLLSIDVVIGPLFSLLVYKEGKKTLKFDLMVVLIIQFCAFGYGLYSIAQGRPAWIVFNQDRFDLIRVNEIDTRNIDKAPIQYQTAPWSGPKWVRVDVSAQHTDTQNKILLEEALSKGEYSSSQSPEFYQTIENNSGKLPSNRVRNLSDLEKFNDKNEVNQIRAKYPNVDSFYPLKSTHKDMVVLLSKKDPSSLWIVDLRPW